MSCHEIKHGSDSTNCELQVELSFGQSSSQWVDFSSDFSRAPCCKTTLQRSASCDHIEVPNRILVEYVGFILAPPEAEGKAEGNLGLGSLIKQVFQ